MKKIILILLTAAITAVFAGCGAAPQTTTESSAVQSESTAMQANTAQSVMPADAAQSTVPANTAQPTESATAGPVETTETQKAPASSSNAGSAPETSKTASTAYIGAEKAKAIALDHAKLTAAAVAFIRVHLDYDDGRHEYEVEFYSGNIEFDYDIDAVTGKILSYDQDAEYHAPSESAKTTSKPAAAETSKGISADEAKKIALKHAGFSESEVTRLTVKQDYDDGRLEYDVEYYVGQIEYSYEIDASTGKVLSYEAEKDD